MFIWYFLLASNLIIPAAMLLFGWILKNNPPQNINNAYGYRTAMSMKNTDTWIFANKLCGKIWLKTGKIMLPLSIIAMLPFMHSSENIIGIVTIIILIFQCSAMILAIYFVEKQLKKKYDSYVRKRPE